MKIALTILFVALSLPAIARDKPAVDWSSRRQPPTYDIRPSGNGYVATPRDNPFRDGSQRIKEIDAAKKRK